MLRKIGLMYEGTNRETAMAIARGFSFLNAGRPGWEVRFTGILTNGAWTYMVHSFSTKDYSRTNFGASVLRLECRFPAAFPEILLTEIIEIIPATETARRLIEGVPVWKK